MEIQEITSNTVKTICNEFIASVKNLGKSKNLDIFHKNYIVYNDAWKAWDTLLKLLESWNEPEYKAYAYSLIGKINPISEIAPVSFDPEIKTLEEFYEMQTKHGEFFPFSPNEIIAWDTEYFLIDDFLSPSIVVLNRIDKISKKQAI